MREIAQAGDLAEVNGKTYLVAQVSPTTINALAAFEVEGDALEPESDANTGDDEPSLGGVGAAKKFVDLEGDMAAD